MFILKHNRKFLRIHKLLKLSKLKAYKYCWVFNVHNSVELRHKQKHNYILVCSLAVFTETNAGVACVYVYVPSVNKFIPGINFT